MISAFGVDHGADVSKGLPRAVAEGGGGSYGSVLRTKNNLGRIAGRMKKHDPPSGGAAFRMTKQSGLDQKPALEEIARGKRVRQSIEGKQARANRAELLNRDGADRRNGYKLGRTSGLKTGYRGRVSNKMKPLP